MSSYPPLDKGRIVTAHRTRLGLLAGEGNCEGPWVLTNGCKQVGVRVYGLPPGAALYVDRDGLSSVEVSDAMTVEIQNCRRYRARKQSSVSVDTPTDVEFVY